MSSTLLAADAAMLWHPYTQHATAPVPVAVSHARGAYLYDAQGRAYADMVASWWVNIHGHGHPDLAKAIADQCASLDHIMFAGFTHAPAVRLAEELLRRAHMGVGSRVFLTDNGSTAIESALKMAIQYWRNLGKPRKRILALQGAYHGDTFGAMSLGKKSGFFEHFEDFFFEVDFIKAPAWTLAGSDQEAIQAAWAQVDEILSRHPEGYAALIAEPLVQGASGMRMHDHAFLDGVIKRMRGQGTLVIFDEVMTGFGRTGTFFAQDQCEQKPDILCVSKGITGGILPLAATIACPRVFAAFEGESFSQALAHGHSYTGNPIACAAANASLLIFEREETMRKVALIHRWLMKHFAERLGADQRFENVRVRGTIAAADYRVRDGAYGGKMSRQLQSFFLEKGFILRPLGNVVYLLPPYCVEEDLIAQACETIIQSAELTNG